MISSLPAIEGMIFLSSSGSCVPENRMLIVSAIFRFFRYGEIAFSRGAKKGCFYGDFTK
jgi:hypothetical protein